MGFYFPPFIFYLFSFFFIFTSLLTWLLLISPRSLGVIGRESPTTGSGRSPQWIWSLPALCMLPLCTSPLEITKTSLLGTFKQTVINGGPFRSTTPRQMKFFATFHWGWISRNFLRLLRERFRAVLMTRPFRLASSFLMRANLFTQVLDSSENACFSPLCSGRAFAQFFILTAMPHYFGCA